MAVAWIATWVVTGGAGAATGPRAATGQGAATPGQGSAQAFTDRIDPRAGSLSVGITFGEAFAAHTNGFARAQSQAIDLGAIGNSLTSYNCNRPPPVQPNQLPQPLIAETGQPGSAQGMSQSEDGGVFSKAARADTTPYGEAVTTTAPLGIANTVSVGGGIAKSWSGLVKGQREAGATVDLSGITFPGGTTLSALHWEALFRSTGDARQSGSFRIGHATIAGKAIPTDDPSATLAQLNAVLGPLGLQLSPPASHMAQGYLFVDPLTVSVVPNSTRDAVLGGAIAGIQPVREPIIKAVLTAFCQANSFIQIADIAVGSISGAGSLHVTVGGVQVTSGDIPANAFNLGLPGSSASGNGLVGSGSPSLGSVGGGGGAGGALGGSAPTALAGAASTPAPMTRHPTTGLLQPITALHGKRGGALALVGLAGLGLIGAMAEGDRRMMRRAQRTVTFEE